MANWKCLCFFIKGANSGDRHWWGDFLHKIIYVFERWREILLLLDYVIFYQPFFYIYHQLNVLISVKWSENAGMLIALFLISSIHQYFFNFLSKTANFIAFATVILPCIYSFFFNTNGPIWCVCDKTSIVQIWLFSQLHI